MKIVSLFLILASIFCLPSPLRAEEIGLKEYQQVVREKIKERVPRLNQCYQNAVDRKVKMSSKRITFVFSITAEGDLEMIQVRETYPMEVLRCVNTNLAGLEFPPPPGKKPLKMQMPLAFKLHPKKATRLKR